MLNKSEEPTRLTLTCSKAAIKILEKSMKFI